MFVFCFSISALSAFFYGAFWMIWKRSTSGSHMSGMLFWCVSIPFIFPKCLRELSGPGFVVSGLPQFVLEWMLEKNNYLPLLDCVVSLDKDGNLSIEVYRKLTHTQTSTSCLTPTTHWRTNWDTSKCNPCKTGKSWKVLSIFYCSICQAAPPKASSSLCQLKNNNINSDAGDYAVEYWYTM